MLKQRNKPINWRLAAVFASGIFLGGVAAAWAVLSMRTPATPQLATQVVKPSAPAKAAPAVAHQHAACPAPPVIAAARRDDGQMREPAGKSASEISALILSGKEAAAAGRLRDAEVSFLSACRAADQLQGDDTMAADARYQLARHYAHFLMVANVPAGAGRTEVARRADLLYSDSLQSFRARYGESHEKTRFAAEGLATLRQPLAQAAPPAQPLPTSAPAAAPPPRAVVAVQPAPMVQPRPAPPAAPTRPTIVATAPPPRQSRFEVVTGPLRQATGAPTQARPSFDCSLARSSSEQRICSDSELAQLDRDLGRLHARAKNSTSDSAAFRRQNEREWRWRESNCRGDRECLLDWYAHRRDQLLEELEASR